MIIVNSILNHKRKWHGGTANYINNYVNMNVQLQINNICRMVFLEVGVVLSTCEQSLLLQYKVRTVLKVSLMHGWEKVRFWTSAGLIYKGSYLIKTKVSWFLDSMPVSWQHEASNEESCSRYNFWDHWILWDSVGEVGDWEWLYHCKLKYCDNTSISFSPWQKITATTLAARECLLH